MEYARSNGSRSFTYEELHNWYYFNGGKKRFGIGWHTIERVLRKLGETKQLIRVRHRNTVKFYLPPLPVHVLKQKKEEFLWARVYGEFDKMQAIIKNVAEVSGFDEKEVFEILSKDWV